MYKCCVTLSKMGVNQSVHSYYDALTLDEMKFFIFDKLDDKSILIESLVIGFPNGSILRYDAPDHLQIFENSPLDDSAALVFASRKVNIRSIVDSLHTVDASSMYG